MQNYLSRFRNSEESRKLYRVIKNYDGRPVKIMEVCGTHTNAVSKLGIRKELQGKIDLISGPGCPVCVTPVSYIDEAVFLSHNENVIILSFGDMLRVPGSETSLELRKSQGADIRIVYSPLDAVKIAADNHDKHVVFLSVGFETTTPVIAQSVLNAKEAKLDNFSILTANKTIPQALELLSSDKNLAIDAYLYPGHVSLIIGEAPYIGILQKYGIPGVIAGFEPNDILSSLILLIKIIKSGKPEVINNYSRAVRPQGNFLANKATDKVFEDCDAAWRGFGMIPQSGKRLQDEYAQYDARKIFDLSAVKEGRDNPACRCGEILMGTIRPPECPLFGTVCTPQAPVGACMVSAEGTCAAEYNEN